MNLGAILRAARERVGLSQEDLALLLDRSHSCISKFERNIKEITWSEAIKWGNVTNSQDLILAATASSIDPIQITQIIEHLNKLGHLIGTIIGY